MVEVSKIKKTICAHAHIQFAQVYIIYIMIYDIDMYISFYEMSVKYLLYILKNPFSKEHHRRKK